MAQVEDCYTVAGAAVRAGVTRSTLDKAIARGEIALVATACGRYRVISRREIERWIADAAKRRCRKGTGRPRKVAVA